MTHLADVVEAQARACAELGSPMYADVLHRVAGDVAAGGICGEIMAGHADAPASDAVPLRFMGSVHRLVLERRAGALATFYPSVGGTWASDPGWQAFRDLLAEQSGDVVAGLAHPPQTNEVGRSAGLIGGLHHLPDALRMPVRLFEIGASAGLNLLADRFAYVDATGVRFGSTDDALVFPAAWSGRPLDPWPGLEFVERAGCDLLPVDARSTEGRLTLTSYVWADQQHRLEHLRAALACAAEVTLDVRRQPAAEFVEGLTLQSGTTTVLWQSVMWQYLSRDEQRSIEASVDDVAALATPASPLVRLSFEPTGRVPEERGVVLRTWTGGDGERAADRHGTGPRLAVHLGLTNRIDARRTDVRGWSPETPYTTIGSIEGSAMAKSPKKKPDQSNQNPPNPNDDIKAKMRLALDKKKAGTQHTADQVEAREKVHGSEVIGGAPKLHRRKAGGGGS